MTFSTDLSRQPTKVTCLISLRNSEVNRDEWRANTAMACNFDSLLALQVSRLWIPVASAARRLFIMQNLSLRQKEEPTFACVC